LELAAVAVPLTRALGFEGGVPGEIQRIVDIVAEPFRFLERLNDPRDLYAFCFCEAR
jgi:hypothetical protein